MTRARDLVPRVALLVLLALLVWDDPGSAAAVAPPRSAESPPRIVVDAPPSLEGTATRLRTADGTRLIAVMRMLGLPDAGGPITVRLVDESSPLALTTPDWIVGFAVGSESTIALFPGRTPSYPDDSLEAVLLHEVAHVLVYRAAEGHHVPRWLNEGLALASEHVWGLDDRVRFTADLMLRRRVALADVETLFRGDARDVSRAYAISGAFVRHLLAEYGGGAGARLLRQLAAGRPFPVAFERGLGTPLAQVEGRFWRSAAIWNRWVPWLTSSAVLWSGITLLALLAIRRRRAQRAELRRRWDEEELRDAESPSPWVH